MNTPAFLTKLSELVKEYYEELEAKNTKTAKECMEETMAVIKEYMEYHKLFCEEK